MYDVNVCGVLVCGVYDVCLEGMLTAVPGAALSPAHWFPGGEDVTHELLSNLPR